MDICPNCKSKLNIDEKASGKCFSCGTTFESSLPKDNQQYYMNHINKCSNCGKILSEDEKTIYKCTSYGTRIKSYLSSIQIDNTVSKAIKICGIAIIILGTILSFIVAGGNGQKYEFSLLLFITPEAISIISGLVFIGFSEIIQLLEDIKNKLK